MKLMSEGKSMRRGAIVLTLLLMSALVSSAQPTQAGIACTPDTSITIQSVKMPPQAEKGNGGTCAARKGFGDRRAAAIVMSSSPAVASTFYRDALGRDAVGTMPPVANRTTKALPAPALLPADDLTAAFRASEVSAASYALHRALSGFRLNQVRSEFGDVVKPGPRDLTLMLRDLAVREDQLDGAEAELAERMLSRPTSDESGSFGYQATAVERVGCTTNVCVTWVEGTVDSPPTADANGDGTPDQIELTAGVFQQVWDAQVGALGYRAPEPDSAGPDSRLDVYVSDLGAEGTYGYCLPEPSSDTSDWSAAGHCGVDNDFSTAQFGSSGGPDALRVTAAHELFHAVQFAYDFLEDAWLMEGTAAWVEDVVFDEINDNYQYLETSALAIPHVPLDLASQEYGTAYGSWLFWRFVTEYFQEDLTQDPSIIRRVWERADGSPGAPDDYSLLAIDNVLRERGSSFRWAFADFTALNNFAGPWYEEGEGYVNEVGEPPFVGRLLSRSNPKMSQARRLDHLTSHNVWLRPGRGLLQTSKLGLAFDLPGTITGSEATVQIVYSSGSFGYRSVRLDSGGAGVTRVPFGRGRVVGVLVTLTNASRRVHSCFQQETPLSCSGYPRDDGRPYVMAARVYP